MKYDNVKRAVFISRPNRFIANVEVDGRAEVVHVKNTGRCKELLIPGCEVWVTEPGTSGRKTKYDLICVRKDNGVLFNIDSQAPNKVVKEWLEASGEYDVIKPEFTYGDSRIDFYMEKRLGCGAAEDSQIIGDGSEDADGVSGNSGIIGDGIEDAGIVTRHLMEVKGCTLEIDGIGYFPDAPTERGVKHIEELIRASKEGYSASIAFVIQMEGVREVRANVATHPEFGEALERAVKAGVGVFYYLCSVTPEELVITDMVIGSKGHDATGLS